MDDIVTVLFVGDSSQPEFAEAIEQMRAACRLIGFDDPAGAISWCNESETPPALVVIASARPGQWSDEAIERLRGRLPLVPFVALLGAWCEGEMRSGAPWPGVVRVYRHQWRQRFAREIARMAAGQCGSWSLPVTASAEERLLSQADSSKPGNHGVVAVVADGRETAEWLVAACRAHGWTTVWNTDWRSAELHGVDVVVWDLGPIEPAAFEILHEIRDVFGDAPVVALSDFPREENKRQLSAAGAAAVLSNPLLVSDLAWQLDRLAGRDFARA